MKNSIVILFLLLLSQFGYAQGRTFKVTARPWVKGQKNLPWKEYDTCCQAESCKNSLYLL